MIFDSTRMAELREKYKNVPKNRVPRIVLLDRVAEFAQECQYLEDAICEFPPEAQPKILGSLFSKQEQQHIGAWFELMLYGWLRDTQIGEVIVEPEMDGQTPDFAIDTGVQKIVIEARAYTKDDAARRKEQWEGDITLALRSIELPYAITYKIVALQAGIDQTLFRAAVIDWLNTKPDSEYAYQDDRGNHIILSVLSESDSGNLFAIGDMGFFAVRSEPLRNRLKSKAGRYKELVRQGNAYVIALYLEPSYLSAEEVVEAWFGREESLIDMDTGSVVGSRIDRSGIHYCGRRILHKSVSGTLVFKRNGNFQHPFVRGWYVENPYATNPIDTNLLPVESHFVVLEKDNQAYKMNWVEADQ